MSQYTCGGQGQSLVLVPPFQHICDTAFLFLLSTAETRLDHRLLRSLMSLPLECWDHRQVLPQPACFGFQDSEFKSSHLQVHCPLSHPSRNCAKPFTHHLYSQSKSVRSSCGDAHFMGGGLSIKQVPRLRNRNQTPAYHPDL